MAAGGAPARVVFTTGFSARYTGGVREFEIEAKNLRGVIKAMDTLFPGLGQTLEDETTVAIDGELYEIGFPGAGEAGGGGVFHSEDRGRLSGGRAAQKRIVLLSALTCEPFPRRSCWVIAHPASMAKRKITSPNIRARCLRPLTGPMCLQLSRC